MGYIGQKISDVAVTVGQGVIDATHIQDASITTADLGNDAVTPNKIDDDGTGFQMGSLGLNSSVIGSDKFTLGGNATLKGDGSDQTLKWHSGSGYVNAKLDVRQLAVSFSGTDKLTSDTSGNFNFAGTVRIPHDTTDALRIGASDDLELWHNGTDSAVTNANTGKLYLWNYANSDTVIGSNNVESAVFTGANTTLRGTLTVSGASTFANHVTIDGVAHPILKLVGDSSGESTHIQLHRSNGHGFTIYDTGAALAFRSDTSSNDQILQLVNSDQSAKFFGQIKGADGSASSPEYAFTNNTDMGMYRGASNTLRFATGGTERIEVQSSQTKISTPVKISHDTYPQLTIDGTDNSGNIGINFIGSGSRGGIQWNSSNNNIEILREDGTAEILVTYNTGTQFNNDVRINGNGTGISKKLRFYTTNNVDDSKWIAVDENYYNVYHAHHNEGHLFRDQTGHLVKIFGNSGGNAETTFGTSSRNNNPRIYGNLRMNVANAASFQNASANETVSLWNGGGSQETVLMCSGGIELRGTTNSQTDSKGRGQINANGSLALNANTTWKTVRTLYGDYQSGILIFHVEDTGNGANTRCQIYAYNADYYERGVNSIDNVTGGVAPGGIEVQIVRDDGSTTSDGGGPYHVQARPANGTSALTVRLLILSAGD